MEVPLIWYGLCESNLTGVAITMPQCHAVEAINAATSGDITLDVTNGALSGSAADLVLAFAET